MPPIVTTGSEGSVTLPSGMSGNVTDFSIKGGRHQESTMGLGQKWVSSQAVAFSYSGSIMADMIDSGTDALENMETLDDVLLTLTAATGHIYAFNANISNIDVVSKAAAITKITFDYVSSGPPTTGS